MKWLLLCTLAALTLIACVRENSPESNRETYFEYSGDQKLSGGSKMIEITTPKGNFEVWTRRVGNNPDMKVLILHGGPGANHEMYEAFNSYLPGARIEYYYYDQLGSFFSDQPQDTSLWKTERFVDEVEQVRKALGLNSDNFYLYGHSWGGILAMEYALKHQENLKGLIISNMMSSIPEYDRYAEEVLAKQMDPQVLEEINKLEAGGDYENPRYMELLMQHYYPQHLLRMPPGQWPNPVNRGFARLNPEVYVLMQGPSEFGVTESARLSGWERTSDLPDIEVPTLVIGAEYDTMDPKHMEMMADTLPKGRYLYCPQGSHLAMYDDQETYFEGLISFIRDVNSGTF